MTRVKPGKNAYEYATASSLERHLEKPKSWTVQELLGFRVNTIKDSLNYVNKVILVAVKQALFYLHCMVLKCQGNGEKQDLIDVNY